jgi:hypothetical protein
MNKLLKTLASSAALPLAVSSSGALPEKNCIPPNCERAEMVFSQTGAYSETLWHNNYNLDESKVPEYTLPPIVSKTAKEWETSERPKVLQQFKDILYGQMPGAPEKMELELLAERDDALEGLAIRKEIRIHCYNNGKHFDYDMMVYIPKSAKTPPPVFVGLNFSGNQANTPDMDVRMTRGMYMNKERKVVPFTDKYRGNRLDSWNFIEAMKRGYAVATACYWEICPDYMTGVKISPFTLFYDEKDLRMDFEVPFAELRGLKWQRPVSIIGAWAWGLSRMLDALEREPLVDSKRAAVVGHSRLGKTALWAGACDERFKLVISNNSGCCGASLSRRCFGENLEIAYWEQRGWYAGGLAQYICHPDKMPIDQHQLLALIAPRTLCVASATEDLNADPKGEFLATKAASPAWRLYGLKGLDENQEMPAPDTPIGTDLCYHLRTGKHAITAKDWECYYKIADRVFFGK